MKRQALLAALMLAFLSLPARAGRMTIGGTTRPELAQAQDRGPVAEDTALEHVLVLRRRAPAMEAAAAHPTRRRSSPGCRP